jgi:hypothetical protein
MKCILVILFNLYNKVNTKDSTFKVLIITIAFTIIFHCLGLQKRLMICPPESRIIVRTIFFYFK